tara:strand:+ start:643 stop:1905 length:1263 start_codon:yes stop_codon:yes gene_type:complete
MTRTHALAVTVAEATKTKEEVGNCRKELHAMVKRLSTMKRQLLAQKEYIEVAVKDALAELAQGDSPYNNKKISDKIVDYRVKLYKHRAFIGRLNSSGFIDDMHAVTPTGLMLTGYTRAIKSGGGLKVPIFNSSQILPGVTTSVDDPERIMLTGDKEVFNGVDIIGTKQFLIGVNSILTHPNNISETLVPGENPTEDKRSYSSVHGAGGATEANHRLSMINSIQAWSAATEFPDPGKEYIQIELPTAKLVTGVVTQGRNNTNQFVTSLTVKTSIDNDKWYSVDSDKHFTANTGWVEDGTPQLKTIPFEQPVLAKYVKIYPWDWIKWMSMRAGVLVWPLEDTPYKIVSALSVLRKFNDGLNPYSAGAKHALSTGVLKGLLMQGNENITGTDSSDSIGNAIPTDGTDSNNKDHFEVIRGFGLD